MAGYKRGLCTFPATRLANVLVIVIKANCQGRRVSKISSFTEQSHGFLVLSSRISFLSRPLLPSLTFRPSQGKYMLVRLGAGQVLPHVNDPTAFRQFSQLRLTRLIIFSSFSFYFVFVLFIELHFSQFCA
jgi:hypothetical protein